MLVKIWSTLFRERGFRTGSLQLQPELRGEQYLCADKVYGGRDELRLSEITATPPEADEVLLTRQALHAHRLRFQHPRKKEWMEIVAPLPAAFEITLQALRTHRPTARNTHTGRKR